MKQLTISSIIFLQCFFLMTSCTCAGDNSKKTPVDYVNPYIGNISHLLMPTYPTVQLPNSMLRVYPKRESYTGDLIYGFPATVVGHRGLSAFRVDPVNRIGTGEENMKGHSYSNEKTTPYSYAVDLDEEDIHVEFAPAKRSAIYSMTFQQGNANLILTAGNGDLEFTQDGICGYEIINGPTKVYLYLETEQKPVKTEKITFDNQTKGYWDAAAKTGTQGKLLTSLNLSFDVPKVNIRYGISYISIEQAKKNLTSEIKNYDMEALKHAGKEVWNKTLGKIQVEGSDENAKTVFYTALYRTYERMINISEDGQYYSGTDSLVHQDGGTPFFIDDWIWDTYLAVHPLRIIIEPEMEQNIINSYIRIAQQSPEGWLPTFPEVIGDTYRMNGNHSIISIWDAYNKGLRNFDFQAAYEASKKTLNERSLIPWTRAPKTELDKIYEEQGFFPALEPGEKETVKEMNSFERRQAVAVTLGDCFDSWALAQMAKAAGNEADYTYFSQRMLRYRNIYNAETGFFHPKNHQGKFIEPFDYVFSGGPGTRDYYDENNGWIYRWSVQHNVSDLINLMGGNENFVKNLDQTFREPLGIARMRFYAQNADHTGNVGQFSMGNEPSMHIPYLYNYAQQPWKTQKRVRELLRQWFRNDLMGVPGDEDGGGLSSFVVFSSLGFYPVTPGLPMYAIGSPVFEKAVIRLPNGKTFTVHCTNYSPENQYIQSAVLNGKEWNKSWFSHEELMQGGVLELNMGKMPNKQWASSPDAVPPSFEMK